MEMKLTNTQAATVGRLMAEAATFASADKMRPILAGVLIDRARDLEPGAGMLRMVGTDSYALGVFTTRVEAPADLRVIVDAAELALIGKQLAKLRAPYGDDMPAVVFTFEQRELIVETPAWRLRASIVEGDYPQWPQLLPVGCGDGETWPGLPANRLKRFAALSLGETFGKKEGGLPLVFTSFGALKPARFTADTEHADFVGLLMPEKPRKR